MSPKTEIQSRQIQWAVSAGLDPDSRGYLPSYSENLFQVLNPKSKSSFDQGSGSELEDTPRRPAKMRALHSSSALAVNFFDTWVASENSPLLNALELGVH